MKPQRILILGGTRFVGRHIVEAAIAAGHQVTLFNRGQTNPGIFPSIDSIHGDRDGGLEGLNVGSWDVVIDVNGYIPRVVDQSATLLKNVVQQYIFISTLSVYRPPFPPGGDETAALEEVDDRSSEDIRTYYGGLKALCEQIVRAAFPERHLLLRLGLMAGPYDPTDRASYWIWRANQPGRIAVPAGPNSGYQFLDARDLANFVLIAINDRLKGTCNTAGDRGRWVDLLETSRSITNIDNEAIWMDDETFLEAYEPEAPRAFGPFPLRLPANAGDYWSVTSQKARSLGLTTRPLEDTAQSLYDWLMARDSNYEWQAGMSADQEVDLLRSWAKRADS